MMACLVGRNTCPYLNLRCLSVCLKQLFSAIRQLTLANETPIESSLPREDPDCIFKAMQSTGASMHSKIGAAHYLSVKNR